MSNNSTTVDVLVLGAGIVGVCTALQLQKRGLQVALVDRRGVAEEASYGNAGMLVNNAIVPYTFPTDVRLLLKCLTKQYGGFNYHVGYSLRNVHWLANFWWHSIGKRLQHLLDTTMPFLNHALAEHHALLEGAQDSDLLRASGWLPVYRDPHKFEQAIRTAKSVDHYGVRYQVLDPHSLYQQFPMLQPGLAGAIHWLDTEFCPDPQALAKQYYQQFLALGGSFYQGDAHSLQQLPTQQWRVRIEGGAVEAEHCVVSLGAWSKALCEQLGYRLPLGYKRGYHMHYDVDTEVSLPAPVTDTENGYVLAPMQRGIRLTAGVELADLHAPPTPRQLAKLERKAKEILPLGARQDAQPWMGVRPCFSDMMPVISRAPRHSSLWFGFGHHHLGLSLGPLTGRLLAEMITGTPTCIEVTPFSATRFA